MRLFFSCKHTVLVCTICNCFASSKLGSIVSSQSRKNKLGNSQTSGKLGNNPPSPPAKSEQYEQFKKAAADDNLNAGDSWFIVSSSWLQVNEKFEISNKYDRMTHCKRTHANKGMARLLRVGHRWTISFGAE